MDTHEFSQPTDEEEMRRELDAQSPIYHPRGVNGSETPEELMLRGLSTTEIIEYMRTSGGSTTLDTY